MMIADSFLYLALRRVDSRPQVAPWTRNEIVLSGLGKPHRPQSRVNMCLALQGNAFRDNDRLSLALSLTVH